MSSIQSVARPSRSHHRLRRPVLVVSDVSLAAFCLLVELTIIVAASVLAGTAYHSWAYGVVGQVKNYVSVGLLGALVYAAAFVIREPIGLQGLVDRKRRLGGSIGDWTKAFLALVVIAFLTKTTAVYSRGALLMFYGVGLVGLLIFQLVMARCVTAALANGHVAPRRVMLVGTGEELREIPVGLSRDWLGVKIVHRLRLPERSGGPEELAAELKQRAAKARRLQLDDVVILTPFSDTERIDQCVEAFSMLPVSIHLGAGRMLDRFAMVELRSVGLISALSLTGPPIAPLFAAVKRASDIVMAMAGLILLAPLFALIALAIKLDSPGPVFFRQRRLGYNRKQFRIIKFRTMTTADDGDVIIQAKKRDKRITRLGAWLRRWNFDELPQLFNVLVGDMSIVGPRPHAVAHDLDFEKRIMRYPRRLNVRPGITGWAQVSGFRGETDTVDKMEGRLQHDLYYIDHWSIGLDFYILLLTLVSPKTHWNAR